jgi:hypothetical protein
MRNPVGSEADAFRSLLYIVAVVAVIVVCVVVIRALG